MANTNLTIEVELEKGIKEIYKKIRSNYDIRRMG